MADVMPGNDRLPSINPDFEVNTLPDFNDEAPTASNLSKKRTKPKKTKMKTKKTDKNSPIKSKSKSKPKSKAKQTPKQNSKKKRKITQNSSDSKRKQKKIKKTAKSKTKSPKSDKKDETKKSTPKNAQNKSKSPMPTLKKQTNYATNTSNVQISPSSSETDNVGFDDSIAVTNDEKEKEMFETQMLVSISPINSELLDNDTTELFTDEIKNESESSDIDTTNMIPMPHTTLTDTQSAPIPFHIPSAEDIKEQTSFDAVYDPSYRHETVTFHALKRVGSDGDLMRQAIKERIKEKQERRAKLQKKQSKTTVFDTSQNKTNLWGRKKNAFPIKNGQQMIIEWRFVTSDKKSHTLVLQHEQIKKKKKSKRMIILDGKEQFCEKKSKKCEFKIDVLGCNDVLDVNIECKDLNAMKYVYRLKINNIAYSMVFHKWSKANV